MEIVTLDPGRIKEVVELAKEYYSESNMKAFSFSNKKVFDHCMQSLSSTKDQVLLAIEEDKVVGMCWTEIIEPVFSYDEIAQNIILYVKKEYRGTRAALKLIKKMKHDVRNAGIKIVKLGTISEINTQRTKKFFSAIGFREVGSEFIMEI